MVLAEIGIFWKVKDRTVRIDTVIVVVIHFNHALSYETYLVDFREVCNQSFTWFFSPDKQVDDHFIDETSLALLKKVSK